MITVRSDSMKWLAKNKSYLVLVLLLVLNWLILKPVLGEDVFYPAHDATWLVRLEQFDKAVSLGQFPPRLAPDMAYGYGYPLFKYYAPLFTFISWLVFKIVGDYALAITLSLLLINSVGSWGMYLLGKKLWGFWGGLISSLAFIFLPFHALDIYVRSALAEMLAINILPFWFYFFIDLVKKDPPKKTVIGFILTSCLLVLAHNLYLIIIAYSLPILLVYYFWTNKKGRRERGKVLLRSALFVLLLTAWYWLPLLLGLGDINLFGQANKTDFADHFVYLSQLWNWTWGFGGSAPGLADGLSFKIGKIQLIGGLLGFILALRNKKKRRLSIALLALAVWSLFLMLPSSSFLWSNLPFLATLQFPWRFLGLLTFLLALFAGGLVEAVNLLPELLKKFKLAKPLIAILLMVGLIYVNFKYFSPQNVIKNASSYFLTKDYIYDSAQLAAEYYPVSVDVWPEEVALVGVEADPDSDQVITVVADTPYEIIFRLSSAGQLMANRFYFPGWSLETSEGEGLSLLAEDQTGRISFLADQSGEYRLYFSLTTIEIIAYVITLLGVIFFLIFIFY